MAHPALVDTIGEVAPDLEVRAVEDEVEIASATARAARPVIVRASVTPAAASRLVSGIEGPGMAVADLIHTAAAEVFEAADWSYWDRRGRLRLWLPEIG